MAEITAEPTQRRLRREPISVKWHHSMFEISLVSVQALTAAVTMVVAIVGALYVHDEHSDRQQARMTRAWSLLHETQDMRRHNVGQIEALQSLHGDGANLRELSLSERYLQGVRLPGADLQASDFTASRLMEADFEGAGLRQAVLERAWLQRADLSGADLTQANLSGTDLREANLRGADLSEANIYRADITGADLRQVLGLTQDMLAGTCAEADQPPKLPSGFAPPPPC